MLLEEFINSIALVIFTLCISIYSIGLINKIKKPSWGERGFLNLIYGLWVKRMIDPKETIIAIQTIRNLIMVDTFISSSMLLLLGLLLSRDNNAFDFSLTATSAEVFFQYRLLLFVAIIVFSVIMFLLSLRQLVRLSILIGIPAKSLEMISANPRITKLKGKNNIHLDAENLRKDVFLKAMNRFTFGMRAVFYGITLILWFLNVYAFIIGTLFLTAYLIVHHDIEPSQSDKFPL